MREAAGILRSSLKDVWDDLWTVLVCNLAWLLGQALIVTGPPLTLALFYYTNRLAHGEAVDLADFWHGFRSYWGVAWRWGAANLLVTGLLLGDFILTGRQGGEAAHFFQGFYLALLAIWEIWQVYTLAFLVEQEAPSLRQALRNGAVLLGRSPGFSLWLVFSLAILLAAGVILFMLSFAFGGFILAAAGNYAVLSRLRKAEIAPAGKEHRAKNGL